MGFLFTTAMGKPFIMALGIQVTISSDRDAVRGDRGEAEREEREKGEREAGERETGGWKAAHLGLRRRGAGLLGEAEDPAGDREPRGQVRPGTAVQVHAGDPGAGGCLCGRENGGGRRKNEWAEGKGWKRGCSATITRCPYYSL